jgi:uncharacterized membrane protein
MFRDSKSRTLAKTIVYRVVAIALLAGITYYFTGSAGEATTITALFNIAGTIAYYGLERLWESVLWGRGRQQPQVDRRAHEGESSAAGSRLRTLALQETGETEGDRA